MLPRDRNERLTNKLTQEIMEERIEAESLAAQISYDKKINSMVADFLQLCYIVIDKRKHSEDDRDEIKDINKISAELFPYLHRSSNSQETKT